MMPSATKAELLAENRKLARRVAALERAKQKGALHAQEVASLRAKLAGSKQRQAATAEILKVIASSPSDVQPVFDAIAKSAMHLLGGQSSAVTRVVGDRVHLAAITSTSKKGNEVLRALFPIPLSHAVSQHAKVARTGKPAFREDYETDPDVPSPGKEMARARGFRSDLVVPMLLNGKPIGGLSVARREAGAFTKEQIGLLETFAAQAVIAIENVRLFNETKESLERQTATAEILKVIAGSPTDTQPVFDAIAENAMRLFAGQSSVVTRVVDDQLHLAAMTAGSAEGAEATRALFPMPVSSDGFHSRVARSGRPEFHHDIESVAGVMPQLAKIMRARGVRSTLAVPMLREGVSIGTIAIARRDPGHFTNQQVGLLQTFADQAVIAIENVRLFNETKEALERQTATAEILKVIAESPTDTQPVFDAIARSGARLVNGMNVAILLRQDSQVVVAGYSAPGREDLPEEVRKIPFDREMNFPSQVILEGKVLHIPDWEGADIPEFERSVAKAYGVKAGLQVPMLRKGEGIGVIVVSRATTGPFDAKDVALLESFADQAVIAIENVRLFNETKEALERQTATAEILKVIASSPSDVRPVLDAVAASSARLCDAADAVIHLRDGDYLRYAAHYGEIALAMQLGDTRHISQASVTGRVALEGRLIHIRDLQSEAAEFPEGADMAQQAGFRTTLVTPLMRNGFAIGTISIRRTEVRPFADAQVELLETFADQAMIAIENVRLFNETKEALERQTATAEILKVIASSPSDVQPVFEAIAARSNQLIGGFSTAVARVFDDALHLVAYTTTNESADEFLKSTFPMPLSGMSAPVKVVRTGASVCIDDIETYTEATPSQRDVARARGWRSALFVPLKRENTAVGVISVTRALPGKFSNHEVELLQTFADQAVIAIENVRLFNETKEGLERQTATAEILKVIASSPSDVQPVFEAIAHSATRLCGGMFANVFRHDGKLLHYAASAGMSDEAVAIQKARYPIEPSRSSVSGRVILSGTIERVENSLEDPHYDQAFVAAAGGPRRMLGVPMLREDRALGAIVVGWATAGPISPVHEQLLTTFANQAGIAIENVRLFNETTEALEQQTATAEILKVIGSSPTDVQPVFDAIVRSAVRLFVPFNAVIAMREGDRVQLRAGAGDTLMNFEKAKEIFPLPFDPDTGLTSRVMAEARTLEIADMETADILPSTLAFTRVAGIRSATLVPLVREGVGIGAISLQHPDSGHRLTDKQMALVKTFADQAVIAIENVRLFNETKEALERQTATAEILKVIASSPADVQPVLDAIAKSAAELFAPCVTGIVMREADQLFLRCIDGPAHADMQALAKVYPMPFDPDASIVARAIVSGSVVETLDTEAPDSSDLAKAAGRAIGFRSFTVAPLLRSGGGIGAISICSPQAGFRLSDKQISLLRTFADQAVIAIENVRLFNETKEALERQTATAEILKVIASSPSDVQPVFDAIAGSALRLLGGHSATVWRVAGEKLRLAAFTATDAAGAEALAKMGEVLLASAATPARSASTRAPVFVADTEIDPSFPPASLELARARGYRSTLSVPMLRDGVVAGVINITRREPGLFATHQVELLQTFADQAVIAIENVRLFNETKEALERQTATAEILKVIARTPDSVQPVFNAIVESCLPLFGGMSVALFLKRGDLLDRVAFSLSPDAKDEARDMFPTPLQRGGTSSRAILTGQVVQVTDVMSEAGVSEKSRAIAQRMGFRSIMAAPLLCDGEALGTINVFRAAPAAFSPQQVALLQTFADQAVIAIENVRLFNETKEALERQTATAEILKVIASSPSNVQPVFDAIVASAMRLMNGSAAHAVRREGDTLHLAAFQPTDPADVSALKKLYPMPLSGSLVGDAVTARSVLFVSDTEADPRVREGVRNAMRLHGFRSYILAPIVSRGEAIGAIVVARQNPGPFTEHEIGLLATFADQAVIAIENVRLFKELESRTAALSQSVDKLTALGEVGQAISSTLDLETVLKTIVSRAVQLTGLHGGAIYEYDEQRQEFRLQISENLSEALVEVARTEPIRLGNGAVGLTGVTREPTQVPDTLADSYQSERKELLIGAGYRAVLAVPLLREDNLLGALLVTRKTPGLFPDETVELLKTFATQSAMAIQNARLFREIAEKGKQLEIASHHKSDFLASMSHELRTPLNAILGFNELILAEIYGTVPEEMKEPLTDIQTSGKHLLRLINNVLDLAKIEAGRMELALAEYSVHDTVESVRSTLRPLAAEKGLEFHASVPEDIPIAYGDFGRLTQCLMNLAGNSLKFTKVGKVEIVVDLNGDILIYRVNDTGIGIPPDKIGSLFTEFKQTDATIASEYGGTGLGLSISRKFIEMHGGRVWVESEVGKGSSFIFEVPLRVDASRGAES